MTSRSISCSVPYTGKPVANAFAIPTSNHANLAKTSEVQVVDTLLPPSLSDEGEPVGQNCSAALFSSDLAPQKQLLINYPSQENLQEIRNVHRKTADREISDLLDNDKLFSREQLLCRSQSVPLSRMVNPMFLMSSSPYTPLSSTSSSHFPSFPGFPKNLSPSVNPSTGSSIAPTPVPSEYNDFGSDYFLDGAEHQFLISDKDISPENIDNILHILEKDEDAQTPDPIYVRVDASNTANGKIIGVYSRDLSLNALQSRIVKFWMQQESNVY